MCCANHREKMQQAKDMKKKNTKPEHRAPPKNKGNTKGRQTEERQRERKDIEREKKKRGRAQKKESIERKKEMKCGHEREKEERSGGLKFEVSHRMLSPVLSSAPATRKRPSGLKHTERTYESSVSPCEEVAPGPE